MLSPAMSIGASGLRAMQQRIDMHSHNIANANTPGYRRVDATHVEMWPGGVSTIGIHRMNPALAQRISALAGQASYSEYLSAALQDSAKTLDHTATAMGAAQEKFNSLLYRAALTPNEPGLGKNLAAQAAVVAREATEGLSRLDEQLKELGTEKAMLAQQVKIKMGELAELNRQALAVGEEPVLRNRQAQVGKELAELVGGEVRLEKDGTASFIVDNHIVVGASGTMKLPEKVGGKLAASTQAYEQVLAQRKNLQEQVATYTDQMNGLNASGTPGDTLFSFDSTTMTFVGDEQSFSLQGANGNPAPLQLMAQAGQSFGEGLVGLTVQAVGQAHEAKASADSRSGSLGLLEERQRREEGVDLDREMIDMAMTQKLYEANAKLIQTADAMLGTLLSIKA